MCSVCPYMYSIYTHCTHCTHGSQAESPLVFQTLIARCHSLTSLSLLETPFLSDASWNAIAGVAKLKSFSTRGEITLHYAALFLFFPHTHTLRIRKFHSHVLVAFFRELPSVRRRLDGSVPELPRSPYTPYPRLPQTDQLQPASHGQPQGPAAPGHLLLFQVCVLADSVILDSVIFFIALRDGLPLDQLSCLSGRVSTPRLVGCGVNPLEYDPAGCDNPWDFNFFLLLSTRVGDFGIQYLTKGLASTKLMELNLSHCSNINDSSVMKITQRCVRTSNHSNVVHRVAWSCR